MIGEVMPRRCPECGGELWYNRDTKEYVCTNCGLVLNRDQLEALIERKEEERRKGRRRIVV